MTNEIIIRDSTLNELTRIQNVINPIISEQVNAHYTFSFDTIVDENMQYLNNKHIIEVDDDYFRIARVVKSRDTSIMSVTVECEHISYDLLDNDEYPMPFEEYEGNVEFMAHELLNGTPFSIGKFEGAGYYFIKPNSDNIRGTLIELANLIGCELEYDKFTINFLNRRGVVSNQKFKLGENLIGVTEEIDYTGGYPRKALEVDVVDLSQVPGYEYLLTIGLGDTVTTIEPILNINETLRIVSKEYNPFQKINPRVQIGNVLRDITDYLKEEDETPTDLGLKEFKIGDVDCLSLSGVEITESYRKYLEDGTPFEVTATVEYPTLEGLTGLFVERSNNFFGIRVKEINNGITTDYFYKDLDSLKTRKYPSTEDTVVLVIISYVSIDYLTANDEFKVYAVKFGEGESDTDNYWLSEFRIGDINCLALSGVQMQSADDEPTAVIEYEELRQHEGLFLTLKEEYADYLLTITDGDYTFDDNDKENMHKIQFPVGENTKLVIIVSNLDNTEHQYFGVKFVEKEPEPSTGGGAKYAYILKGEYENALYNFGVPCYRLNFINNIDDFRSNFMDDGFYFNTENTTTSTEYYPCAKSIQQLVDSEMERSWTMALMVQVTDGLISSVITTLYYSQG